MLNQDDYRALSGRTLVGSDGEKLGKIDQLYADREDGHPTFLTVSTGMFGSRTSFVPVGEADLAGEEVRVPYSKDMVKDAPNVDPDGEITPEEEDRLYAHYNMTGTSGYETAGTTTGTAGRTGTTDRDFEKTETTTGRGTVGRDVSGPETDEAMTRSEERLRVGTEQVQTGRARLRKYIVTENVTQTVPVSREEVRLEREPITDENRGDAMGGADLSEEEHEVVLTEERPVIAKETVPVERVRLGKETVTEEKQVSETVGKEKIEVDGAESTTRGDRDLTDRDRNR